MTSILKNVYADNIARTNASASNGSRKSVGEGIEKKRFSDLLVGNAQADKKSVVSEASVVTDKFDGGQSVSKEDMLSNAEPSETDYFRARLAVSEVIKSYENSASMATAVPSADSVKNSVDRVNITSLQSQQHQAAPEPTLDISGPAVGGQLPSSPNIVRARVLPSKTPRLDFSTKELKEMVISAGRFHGVDPALGLAVAKNESSFDAAAISKDGHESKGLFQLLDSTAGDLIRDSNIKEDYDAFDPGMNSLLGVGYLRQLMEMFSEPTSLNSKLRTSPANSADDLEKLAVAAFNAGQGRVAIAQQRTEAAGGNPALFSEIEEHLPASTREYVQRVFNSRVEFQSEARLYRKG